MNDLSLQSAIQNKFRSISTGVKLIVVCILALLMTIPSFFVSSLIEDRTQRARDVVKEIGDHVGGQQTFLGPTLAVPYIIPAQSKANSVKRGTYFIFPTQASAAIKTTTEERHRSLFKVPVFQADMQLDATFDLAGTPAAAPQGAQFDWSRAELVVGVSGARGALADGTLTIDGKTSTFDPAEICPHVYVGSNQSQRLKLTLFGAASRLTEKPIAPLKVSSSLRFSGAQRIALLAYGKTTHLSMQGDWPNPGFDGGFLPVTRTVTPTGFNAEWSVPFIARDVPTEGGSEIFSNLDAASLGVSFIEVVDPYQSVNRSLKYVLLFLGLIFLSYFVFEVTIGKRVHAAQYILIGIAQIIFYLLLLSFAERIGFDLAFLIAGGSTVILLSLNAGWVFASRAEALKALAIFTSLYVLIYLLLRLEDNALLIGAIASFAAVAAAMYITRSINWYSSLPAAAPGVPIDRSSSIG